MKPPVVPVPAPSTAQLKKGREEKHLGDPAAPQSLLVGLQTGLQAVPQECIHSAIARRQGSVLPLCHLWPRTLPEWEIRVAFKFSGKSLRYLQPLKLALQNLAKSTCFSLVHFGAFSVKKLCPECSLETSNGNTYYMKQGFPNTSCFRYCLLQQPSLLTGTAAGAAGVSCGQGSWHRWYQPYASAHLTSSSPASCQPSPSTRMPTVSFLIFPQSHSLPPPPPFPPVALSTADQHWQCTAKRWLRWQRLWDTACVQVPASQLRTFLHNTQSSLGASSRMQAAGSSCLGKWWITVTNHFRKKKKVSEMLICLRNVGFCRNFSMNFRCSALHGLFLARHNALLNVQPLELMGFSKFSFSE